MKLSFDRAAYFTLGVMLTIAVTAPAKAETRPRLFGNIAGRDFCRLRALGVPKEPALQRAMADNFSSSMTEETIGYGKYPNMTPGALDMAEYITYKCPNDL
jgi:hypothetical protein